MNKPSSRILTVLLLSVLASSSLITAPLAATIETTKSELAKTNLSKSELCDFAIQALSELLKQSTDGTAKPAITKEQCMAISDDDIDKAAKKMMESGKLK